MNREHVRSVVLADLKRANDFFEEKVEPKLLERRDFYFSSKKFYEEKFPKLSAKSDFRSFDFYAYVQWAKSLILDSFFGPSKVLSVVGLGAEDERAAALMNRLIDWQLEHQGGGYSVFSQWTQDGLVYDFGIVKSRWERSTEAREFEEVFPPDKLEMLMADPDVEVVSVSPPDFFGDAAVRFKRVFVLENKPVDDNVSPFDLRWSPEARTLESANFVAQRQFVSFSELVRGVDSMGYDASAVRRVTERGGGIRTTVSDSLLNPELEDLGTETENGRTLTELYECYVNVDADGDGVLESLIVTVADDEVLRVVANGFERLPFFLLSLHKDPFKVFPLDLALADISGELQHLRVAMVRQLLVNLSISNTPRKFIDNNVINMDDVVEDRMFVRCNGNPHQAVMPESPTPIAGWTMNFFEYLKSVEEEWTGRTRFNQGMDAASLNHTATGVNAIMGASAQRINACVKNFAETGFKDFMRFRVMLNERFMDDGTMIRIFNEPLGTLSDDYHGDLDVVVDADVGLEKKQRVVQALSVYLKEGFAFAMQLGLAGPEHFLKASVRLLELSGVKNASEMFRSPEEFAQAQAEAKQREVMNGVAGVIAGGAAGGYGASVGGGNAGVNFEGAAG